MSKTSSAFCLVGVLTVFAAAVAALWTWAVPAVVSWSSFAFIVAFIIGSVIVTLSTWRNAQATTTVGQLLQAMETGDGHAAASAGTQPRSK